MELSALEKLRYEQGIQAGVEITSRNGMITQETFFMRLKKTTYSAKVLNPTLAQFAEALNVIV